MKDSPIGHINGLSFVTGSVVLKSGDYCQEQLVFHKEIASWQWSIKIDFTVLNWQVVPPPPCQAGRGGTRDKRDSGIPEGQAERGRERTPTPATDEGRPGAGSEYQDQQPLHRQRKMHGHAQNIPNVASSSIVLAAVLAFDLGFRKFQYFSLSSFLFFFP